MSTGADPGVEDEKSTFPPLAAREQHWNHRAGNYADDVRGAPVRSAALSRLLAIVPLDAKRVLDAGTGTGVTALALRSAIPHAEICATDISSEMLREARLNQGADSIAWIRANNVELPFPSGRFDLITSSFTLHHLPPLEQMKFLKELRRTTGAGGEILLVDQTRPSRDVGPSEMNQMVVDLFYSHLTVRAGRLRLAGYGEWPLTVDELISRAGDVGMDIDHHFLHPLVSVFKMKPVL